MFKDKQGNTWYKVGLHIHTTLSDGRKSPEEMAEIYKNAGFDAVAITDHWKFYPEGEINGLSILSGCEYNIGTADCIEGVMHIVGLGIHSDPSIPRDADAQAIIDGIKKAGGLAILAHPAWSLNTVEETKKLNGFFGTEIYNTVSGINQSDRPYSGHFADSLANQGICFPLLATDDTHYYDGNDETKSFVYIKAESNRPQALLSALQKGDFFSSQAPWLSIEKQENKIKLTTSPCSKIVFFSNASFAPDRIVRGENLTEAVYPLKPFEKWVRVEVTDQKGNCAWSNYITL